MKGGLLTPSSQFKAIFSPRSFKGKAIKQNLKQIQAMSIKEIAMLDILESPPFVLRGLVYLYNLV